MQIVLRGHKLKYFPDISGFNSFSVSNAEYKQWRFLQQDHEKKS